MKATDFKLTNSHDGQLSTEEVSAALVAANDVLEFMGGTVADAEAAACRAAFHTWARWPESAELVVEA